MSNSSPSNSATERCEDDQGPSHSTTNDNFKAEYRRKWWICCCARLEKRDFVERNSSSQVVSAEIRDIKRLSDTAPLELMLNDVPLDLSFEEDLESEDSDLPSTGTESLSSIHTGEIALALAESSDSSYLSSLEKTNEEDKIPTLEKLKYINPREKYETTFT